VKARLCAILGPEFPDWVRVVNRDEWHMWLRMLALCAWLRGGIVDPAALGAA
jgi:hypothetical protein